MNIITIFGCMCNVITDITFILKIFMRMFEKMPFFFMKNLDVYGIMIFQIFIGKKVMKMLGTEKMRMCLIHRITIIFRFFTKWYICIIAKMIFDMTKLFIIFFKFFFKQKVYEFFSRYF